MNGSGSEIDRIVRPTLREWAIRNSLRRGILSCSILTEISHRHISLLSCGKIVYLIFFRLIKLKVCILVNERKLKNVKEQLVRIISITIWNLIIEYSEEFILFLRGGE